MGFANYKIFGSPGEWHVEHDGKVANTFATKESAFEAAAGTRLRVPASRRSHRLTWRAANPEM